MISISTNKRVKFIIQYSTQKGIFKKKNSKYLLSSVGITTELANS